MKPHRKSLTKTRMEQNMICELKKCLYFFKKYRLIDLNRLKAETHNNESSFHFGFVGTIHEPAAELFLGLKYVDQITPGITGCF